MVTEERILAPAKVNLYLRILGRRADGYHLLDSVMAPIGLFDELVVRITPDVGSAADRRSTVVVTSDSEHAPGGQTNLAYRAAELLLANLDRALHVEIDLRKRIPVGSGLGGGSSDAAAVLLALNRFLGHPHSIEQLGAIGGKIGADVTFFVYGRPARVGGVGERIAVLDDWRPLSLVVCSDGAVLSTKSVYSGVDLSLTTRQSASNITAFIGGREPVSDLLVNDLEPAAAEIHPGVLSVKARLLELGALGALMTGSGSAVFGIWPDLEGARAAATTLRAAGLWAEAAETLAQSPAVRC